MEKKQISIYDTTLRDGSQAVGISLSINDKISIAKALDKVKIDYIEGGWPGSNPKDDQFFIDIKKEHIEHAKIAAFGSTKRSNLSFENDHLLQALVASQADIVTIVAKSWDFHVTRALNIELKENLKLIYDTIAYLKDKGFSVFLDAEHFYDGFQANHDYSLQCLDKAKQAGADMLVLCDTNGGRLTHEVESITKTAIETFDTPIGVHFHNDSGVAVANSLACIQAGAVSVQGTVNGY